MWSASIFKPHQSQFANDTTTSTKQQSVIHSKCSQTSDTQNREKAWPGNNDRDGNDDHDGQADHEDDDKSEKDAAPPTAVES